MKLTAVAFCAAMLAGSPAVAQWGPYGPAGYRPYAVSPYRIDAVLRANGLRPIARPVQTGPYIVVRALDGYGETVRVLLNARYGNIVQVTPLPPAPVLGERHYRPYGAYPYPPYEPYRRYGDARPDLKVEPAPYGGPVSPPHGSAISHNSTAAAPARTPLPRARPPAPAATAKAVIEPAPAATSANSPAAASPPPAPAATSSTGPAAAAAPSANAFPPAATLE